MLSSLRELSHKIRTAVCCICFAGPVLVIVGIIFLTSAASDSRGHEINQYNAAINAWMGTDSIPFSRSSFVVSGVPLDMRSPQGNPALDGDSSVEQFVPYVAVADSSTGQVSRQSSGQYSITVLDASGSPSIMSVNIPGTQTSIVTKQTMNCRLGQAGECPGATTSSSYKNCIARPFCSSTCASLNGQLNTATGSCSVPMYLASVCLRVDRNMGGQYTVDTSSSISPNVGCYYENNGFQPGVYTNGFAPTSMLTKFEIRSDDDPLIALSKITSGSYTFGLTKASKITIGIVLLVLGILITLCVCAGVAFALNRLGHLVAPQINKPAATIAVVASQQQVAPYPVFQAGYVPQPGYPQQLQQGYPSQPQPGYAPQLYTQPQQYANQPQPQQQHYQQQYQQPYPQQQSPQPHYQQQQQYQQQPRQPEQPQQRQQQQQGSFHEKYTPQQPVYAPSSPPPYYAGETSVVTQVSAGGSSSGPYPEHHAASPQLAYHGVP
ncbi:hypothetical protein HKX48_005860 [Thoreauomyces humboldtii]|nr:hypothetical protein HKX48_005860 [Thoreauomyces humboldtii]